MPIPFLEALRGRLAPVFNGTVPLEREKERGSKGPGREGGGEGREERRRRAAQTHNGRHTNTHLLRSGCGVALKWRQV